VSEAVIRTASRAERKERTRQALLDATLKLIAQRSLASISLREVAREAGIVPTAFYRHFESIDTLGIELVDESMRPLRQMIRDTRRSSAGKGDIISATVEILARQVRDNPAQFRFLSRERYGGVHAVRRAIEKMESIMLVGHLHTCVVDGIREGRDEAVLSELSALYEMAGK